MNFPSCSGPYTRQHPFALDQRAANICFIHLRHDFPEHYTTQMSEVEPWVVYSCHGQRGIRWWYQANGPYLAMVNVSKPFSPVMRFEPTEFGLRTMLDGLWTVREEDQNKDEDLATSSTARIYDATRPLLYAHKFLAKLYFRAGAHEFERYSEFDTREPLIITRENLFLPQPPPTAATPTLEIAPTTPPRRDDPTIIKRIKTFNSGRYYRAYFGTRYNCRPHTQQGFDELYDMLADYLGQK